jgi:hypothetical protein
VAGGAVGRQREDTDPYTGEVLTEIELAGADDERAAMSYVYGGGRAGAEAFPDDNDQHTRHHAAPARKRAENGTSPGGPGNCSPYGRDRPGTIALPGAWRA